MLSVSKKTLDLTLKGSRMMLAVSRPYAVSAAAGKTPLASQKTTTFDKTSTRPITTSFLRQAESSNVEVPVVPIEIIERAINEQLVLIDVRSPQEVSEFGKIPTANVLPVDDIESALKLSPEVFRSTYHFEKPLQSALIVVYCRSGKRAARAGSLFRDQFGYKNVVNYMGSWLEWAGKHPEDVKAPPR